MSLFLTTALLLQTASIISLFNGDNNVFAAEMGGTSKEVLDSLRIESKSVDVGNDGENPYSENTDKVINMFPRMELMMYNNVGNQIKVYNYDKPVNSPLVIESRKRLIWNHTEYGSSTTRDLAYTNSIGIEIDFDGRKNHVARVGSNTTFLLLQKRRTRTLFIEDAKGTVLSHIELTSNDVKSEGYYDGYNLLADVPITAGDFDGDGAMRLQLHTQLYHQINTIRK